MQMPANIHIKILLLLLFYGLHRHTLPWLASSSYPFFIFALSKTIKSSRPAISQMLIQVRTASFLYFHISPLTTQTAYSVVPFSWLASKLHIISFYLLHQQLLTPMGFLSL